MNPYALGMLALAISAAVLFYGSLGLYVGANRPGDRPTWADACSFVAGIAGAVLAAFHRTAQGVVNK